MNKVFSSPLEVHSLSHPLDDFKSYQPIMPVIIEELPDALRDKDNLDLKSLLETKAWLAWKRFAQRTTPFIGEKKCILIPGMQRSGSKLLVRVFEWSQATDCYPEEDKRAFDFYQMRNTDRIRHLIKESPAEFFVIKSLCESDQTRILMEYFAPAKAIWIWRDFRDCVNSCIRNFNGFSAWAQTIKEHRLMAGWRGRGMSDETWELLKRFSHLGMNEATGAALQWYYRNVLFFEQALQDDSRVMTVRYEALVSQPEETAASIFAFAGITGFSPWSVRKIHARSIRKNAAPPIAPEVFQLCMGLQDRFNALPAPQSVGKQPGST